MNPEPTTLLTSQRPYSRRAPEQGESITGLSTQSTPSDLPPLFATADTNVRDHAANIKENRQLDGSHGILEKPNSGGSFFRASVQINAEFRVESDHIATIAAPPSATSQLEAGGSSISSISANINVHARDIQSGTGSLFSFEPLRRPSIPDTPGSTHPLKHPGSQILTEPPPKKRRPELRRRYTFGSESFPEGFTSKFSATSPTLPSPGNQNQVLPRRHSTAHVIAAIRSKIREDSGGVTTLKLARGSIGNGIAQHSSNIPGNLASMEDKSSAPMYLETRSTPTGVELLGKVGIVELLDQDERPTFIIDVANPANYTAGSPLQIIFANASLCAHEVSFLSVLHVLPCSVVRTSS
jgi:hypothetical protein